MRKYALLVAVTIAATHFASAEDYNYKKTQGQKHQAHRNAGHAKPAGGNQARFNPNRGNQARFNANRGNPQFQAQRQFQAQQNRRNFNPDFAESRARSRNFTPRVATAEVPQANVGVVDAGGRTRSWHNGSGNQDWRNRRGDGDQNWRRDGNPNWRADGNQNWKRDGNQNWRNRRGHHRTHWNRTHRHRSWWTSHYNRFSRFGNGYYYWDSGFWYPAYGYDPYFSTYSYDAPIYGYNDLEPGQVIANVQAQLQQNGYYNGELDGQFGPMTRRALLDFQRDNGLPDTGEIDEATLDALGLQ